MASTSSVEAIVEALNDFLDVAVVEIVPERDSPTADGIGRRICAQWPASDDAWDAARAAIAEGVAAHLGERPERWARALHIIALYVDRVRFDEPNPRHEGDARIFNRGKPVYVVELGLAPAVAAELLARPHPHARVQLFESLDEWDAWEATARALADRPPSLEAREVLALVTHALLFTTGVVNGDAVIEPILSGLVGSEAAVDAVLEGWLDAVVEAEPRVIGLLARWRLPARKDDEELRQRLVRKLARSRMDQGVHEALLVALRSWPSGVPLSTRSEALLDALDRMGPAGAVAALVALAFDESTPPLEALPLLDAIIERSDASDGRLPFARLRVLRWMARSLSQGEASPHTVQHARELLERLPPPSNVPPDPAFEVDRTLEPLAAHDPQAVRGYVFRWLEEHRALLAARGESLSRALPSTRRRLPGFGWLVDAAVSASPSRRRVAVWCLVDPDSGEREAEAPLTTETCRGLTPTQVEGLAHMLLSQAGLGAVMVDLLFGLARARPDCLDVLGSLLERHAMRTYTGRHEQCVEQWAAAIAGRPEDDPEAEMVQRLRQAIAVRRRGFEVRNELGHVLFDQTRPTARAMRELTRRQMRLGEEAARQRSAFMELATRIPIACGEAWDPMGNSEQGSSLQAISWEVEGLALDAYDPLAARLARLEHARQAQRLLGDDGDRGGDEP